MIMIYRKCQKSGKNEFVNAFIYDRKVMKDSKHLNTEKKSYEGNNDMGCFYGI